MKRLIFNTNAVDLLISESLPLKWNKYWREILNKTSQLLLFEPLITEFFYKLSRNHGYITTQNKILQLKSLESMKFITIDDNLAISAGKVVNKYQKYKLSLVDSYILACGKKFAAKIITTDPGIKNASRDAKVSVDFIALKEIKENKSFGN